MRSVVLALTGVVAVALLGCPEMTPAAHPEASCRSLCQARVHQCSEHDCSRGCGFILDRLVEHETEGVVACVARAATHACGDPVWADCAASVGPHSDGGPPPPPPPAEE